MRSILIIAVKGIFKRKTYTITIFMLSLIAAVSMATALGTIFRIHSNYEAAVKKTMMPDITYECYHKNFSNDFVDFFKSRSEIKNVIHQEDILAKGKTASLNNQDLAGCLLAEYNQSENNFTLSCGDGRVLKSGEIYVPVLYKSQYNAKTGDLFNVKTDIGTHVYKIAGFADDPMLGSTFTNIQRVMFCKQDIDQLKNEMPMQDRYDLINVYLKDEYSGVRLSKTAKDVTNAFGKETLMSYYATKDEISGIALMASDLVSLMFMCFSVLLLFTVILVIRHAVLSAFEADYVSLGVLKAIGFTGGGLKASTLLQYTITSTLGALLGILAAVPITPIVGGYMIITAGLFWKGGLDIGTALLTLLTVVLITGVSSLLSARRISRISPVTAIASGKSPVYFSHRFNLPLKRLYRLPLSLRMAVKQVVTRRRQYASLLIIIALFTFMTGIISVMADNFSNKDTTISEFGYGVFDILVSSTDSNKCGEADLNKIVSEINNEYGVVKTYDSDQFSWAVKADNAVVSANINSSFDNYKDSLVKGRMPRYDNEIAVTGIVSKNLNKGIGDYVTVELQTGASKRFLIVGINQFTQYSGKNVSFTSQGFKSLYPDYKLLNRAVKLKSNEKLDDIVSSLRNKYMKPGNGVNIANEQEVYEKFFSSVNSITKLCAFTVYFLTMLLIATITFLLCAITIYRESTDTGIFKATGFNTGQLRRQFTLRFAVMAIIGGCAGMVTGFFADAPLISAMFSSIGMGKFVPNWSFTTAGLPLCFVIAVTALTAWLASIRIKRISPSNLISE